jgi:cell division protein FtsN
MAVKKRRKAGRRSTDRNRGAPGWIYMLMGLAIGLAVAFAVYVSDREKPVQEVVAPAATPAPAAATVTEEKAKPAAAAPDGEVTLDFYDMLPNLDVEVFDDERAPVRAPQPADTPPTVSKHGIYIIQAGSFSTLADANRRKAELGLLGVYSEIKKGSANGRTVYRVYTDPMEQPADVNRTSNLLTGAGIEIMLKRVSD